MRSSAGECTMQCRIEHEHRIKMAVTVQRRREFDVDISISVEYKEVLILEILLLCTVLLVGLCASDMVLKRSICPGVLTKEESPKS